MAALCAKAASGELAALKAQPHALSLCLPAIHDILSSALDYLTGATKPSKEAFSGNQPVDSTGSNATGQHRASLNDQPVNTSGSTTSRQLQTAIAQQWVAVAKVLAEMLHQQQLGQLMVPLIARCFALHHSTAATYLCIGLLNHFPMLYDKFGLDMYLAHFHPIIMHLVVAPDSYSPTAVTQSSKHGSSATQTEIAASFERAQLVNAASTALCSLVSSKLTLPVVLEHVIRALLMALGNSPDVAVALIGVGSAIGGDMAALHLLPSLVMVLISSSSASSDRASQASSAGKTP